MLDWLHDLPTWLGALVVSATFVVPTMVGSFLLQPSIARLFRGERDINTVLGFLLNAFALYFGVLLALLSIAVFENHTRAEDAVVREAVSIIKLYRDLNGYPEPMRTQLSNTLHEYVDETIGPGWVMQQRGEPNPKETAITFKFHRLISDFKPADSGASIQHAEMLRGLNDFIEARRLRISAGGEAIPKIMWFIVLVGAVMNVFVIWMFDLRPVTHAIIGGTLSLFIGLVIYMVAVLDAPFRGVHGLKPDAIVMIHGRSGLDKRD
jgi:hypothetical protein